MNPKDVAEAEDVTKLRRRLDNKLYKNGGLTATHRKIVVDQIMADFLQLLHDREAEARIAGIDEAHKEILDIVFTYRGDDLNYCDVDDVSRVAMSWKVDRIAQLKAEQGAE